MIQETNGIFYHFRSIFVGVMGLVALAMSSIVDSNDAIILGQRLPSPWNSPIDRDVGDKSVNQQNGLAFAFVGVVNLHAIRVKKKFFGAPRTIRRKYECNDKQR